MGYADGMLIIAFGVALLVIVEIEKWIARHLTRASGRLAEITR